MVILTCVGKWSWLEQDDIGVVICRGFFCRWKLIGLVSTVVILGPVNWLF